MDWNSLTEEQQESAIRVPVAVAEQLRKWQPVDGSLSIYLIGSMASGRADEWSDIDFLLVGNFEFTRQTFRKIRYTTAILSREAFRPVHVIPCEPRSVWLRPDNPNRRLLQTC